MIKFAVFSLFYNASTSKAFALHAPSSDIIDLQSQHYVVNPAERMKSIEEACEKLGVEKFDVYGDYTEDATSSYLRKFESEIARDFGKEDAVFMPSGTMAQNIALLIHSKKEHMNIDEIRNSRAGKNYESRFACHHTSHLLLWEEESYSKLVGMRAVPVDTRSKSEKLHVPPMRFDDVESVFLQEGKKCVEGGSLSKNGLSSLLIELPHRELGGKLTPWEDIVLIGDLCKKHGVKYHCDGARIFEASAGYGKSLSELADPFDSFYISFYKGLGSISGAMLMGNKEFCDEARVWLTRFGGNLYTKLPYAVPGWARYREKVLGHGTSMTFLEKLHKLKRIAERIESETTFPQIASFDPPLPETNMVHVCLKKSLSLCETARDEVFESFGLKVFSRIKEIPSDDVRYSTGYRSYLEWTMGDANGSVDDESFVKAWGEFSSSLLDK